MTFTVAIVGRPNVGKSTLFNRLTGKRQALVDDAPGVTRDRREGRASLAGLEFTIIDTAGLEEADEESLQGRMTRLSEQAIRDADVALLMVDGRAGITPADRHFAGMIRKSGKRALLVINKAEGSAASAAIAESYALGMGDPVAISAEHGEGLADLYDALAPFANPQSPLPNHDPDDAPVRIAIVGRPNVGKSTLMNKILGRERVLTGPEAGITRDSILVSHNFEGTPIQLVDTAGMRRKAGITAKIEKLAVADTLETIRYAQIVVMMLDAQAPLEKQDNTIAALVEQEGRAMVVAVNKWDAIDDKPAYLKAIHQRMQHVLPQVKGIPVVPLSARTGQGVRDLLNACFTMYAQWNRRLGTGELNRWLEDALLDHTPPMIKGRRLKIRYMTQKSARPPSFILFSNIGDIPGHYLGYLTASLRERFALPGVPIRIKVRKNKNPYETED